MNLRKTVIGLGAIGLICANPAFAASALFCAAYVYCNNATHCNMGGDMSELMYSEGSNAQNGTKIIPFSSANSNSVSKGQSSCAYYLNGNWPSFATFFTLGNVELYPQYQGVENNWNIDGDEAQCAGFNGNPSNATLCPFIAPPRLN